jgi:hypothetical protein
MSRYSKKNYIIKKSPIHGNGVFTTKYCEYNEIIDIGIEFNLYFFPKITQFGSMINHSYKPSCKLAFDKYNNVYYVVPIYNLQKDTEITVNYNDCPWFIERAKDYYI